MAAGADREVPVTAHQLADVEIFTLGVEDPGRVDRHGGRAAIGLRPHIRARAQRERGPQAGGGTWGDDPPHSIPWVKAIGEGCMTSLYSRAVPAHRRCCGGLQRSICGGPPGVCKDCAIVVEQDPARRGVDVIELAGPDGPRKGCDRDAGEHQGEREDEIEDGHRGSSARNARERSELASTVSELRGMTAAAISGWIQPSTARLPASRL